MNINRLGRESSVLYKVSLLSRTLLYHQCFKIYPSPQCVTCSHAKPNSIYTIGYVWTVELWLSLSWKHVQWGTLQARRLQGTSERAHKGAVDKVTSMAGLVDFRQASCRSQVLIQTPNGQEEFVLAEVMEACWFQGGLGKDQRIEGTTKVSVFRIHKGRRLAKWMIRKLFAIF